MLKVTEKSEHQGLRNQVLVEHLAKQPITETH